MVKNFKAEVSSVTQNFLVIFSTDAVSQFFQKLAPLIFFTHDDQTHFRPLDQFP